MNPAAKFKSLLTNISQSDKKLKIAIAVGFLGIAVIFLSTLGSGKEENSDNSNSNKIAVYNSNTVDDESELYKDNLEKELESFLYSIVGVGEVRVMLSVEGTTEYVYAEEISADTDYSGENSSQRQENKIVIIENDGTSQALVKKVIRPKVVGVCVVCRGGGSVAVKEKVINAVSTMLDISSNRICVEAMA